MEYNYDDNSFSDDATRFCRDCNAKTLR